MLGGGQVLAQAVGGLPCGCGLMGHSAFELLIGQPYAEEENATVAAVTGATKGSMLLRPLQVIGKEERNSSLGDAGAQCGAARAA